MIRTLMKFKYLYLYLLPYFLLSTILFSITITGTVIVDIDKKPIELGTVAILEEKIKTRIDEGSFSLSLKKEGEYTILVSSPGYATYQKKMFLKENEPLTISLSLATVKGATLTLQDRRDVQVLSRNTLNQKQLKGVAAGLNDSLSALATLPGVVRYSTGIFFPLIIRGIDSRYNRYYIDDIPILNPQHFGGLHSIISNELVSLIDLYSSAAPASYAQSLGAVIETTTKEEVKNFAGLIIQSPVSIDIYLEGGITKIGNNTNYYVPLNSKSVEANPNTTVSKDGKVEPTVSPVVNEPPKKDKIGYWITSGRASYLAFVANPILKNVLKSDFRHPYYFDWQVKGKIFLDNNNQHSLTLLYFGFYDSYSGIDKYNKKTAEEKKKDGDDPIGVSRELTNTIFSNNIGLYYNFDLSERFKNKVIVFNAFNDSKFYSALDYSDVGLSKHEIDVSVRPNVLGIKDKLSWEWLKNYAILRTGFDISYYYFKSKGASVQNLNIPSINIHSSIPNAQPTQVPINFNAENFVVEGYADNSFKFFGINFTPGVHASYLHRTKELRTDPRILLSYKTPWDTVISSSVGWYSSFPQVNFFIFNQPFNQQPQVSIANYIKSEKGRHIVGGIEQKFLEDYSIKVEGFYNTYSNLLENDTQQGNGRLFRNSGAVEVYGAEFLFRFDSKIKTHNLYGWVSYTYSHSIATTGLPLTVDPNGDKYFRSSFDQTHSIKLVAGYKFKSNTIGARFQLVSGNPYTGIIGAQRNNIPGIERYSPVYGTPYGEQYPLSHSLDIRYSRTDTYKWGSITWYIEVLNAYYSQPRNQQGWNYNLDYAPSRNPTLGISPSTFYPSGGVEIRF